MTSDIGSPKAAAERWGVSLDTVHKWRKAGRIVSFQPNGKRGRILIPLDQFDAPPDEDAA